jgi:outer membrane protein TolC
MPQRLFSLSLFLFTSAALAQNPASPAPAQPAQPAQPAAPGAPPVAASPAEPTLPSVTDAMLDPPPPPANVLSDWREALRLLRSNSTNLRTLRARADVARAQARQALAPALPSLTGDAAVNHHLLRGERTVATFNPVGVTTISAPDPATTWNAGLTLRVPLIAFETWYNRGTALAAIEVARLNTKAAERLEIAAVADAVVTAVTAERLAEVSRVSLESALSTLNLTQRRAELGAASALDVLRIEQEASLSRSQVVSANDGVLRAREALGSALGTSEAYGVTPHIRLDTLAADARSTCRATNNVEGRADVRAAKANVRIAQRNSDAVSRSYLPTLDAISDLTYWSNTGTANNRHVTWTIGAVLSWTLYDGGLRYATRDQREAEIGIASTQLSESRRLARLEVTQSLRALRAAEATLAVSARTREIAAETARLSKIAYLNGSGTSFDLVDTARRLREAELDYTIKEFEVLRAKIAALLALAVCDV